MLKVFSLFEVNVKSSCFNGVTILAWDVKGIFVERLLNRNRKPTLIAGDTVLKYFVNTQV